MRFGERAPHSSHVNVPCTVPRQHSYGTGDNRTHPASKDKEEKPRKEKKKKNG